ncbi:hypothetical protein Tco_0884542 [Tanacetum coccineum]
MRPLFSYQKLANHIDGTLAPPATILAEDKTVPNPAFKTWNNLDQRAVILLNSSLTEEAAIESWVSPLLKPYGSHWSLPIETHMLNGFTPCVTLFEIFPKLPA